ncbi:MAG: protein kinase [Acidobacteriota bacterium]
MPLTPRASEIMRALELLPPGERGTALDRLCGDAPDVRREVEGYLASVVEAATRPASRAALDLPGTLPEGTVLGGRFRITAVLASGGFGVVYRAIDQDGRLVALKAVRLTHAGLIDALRREIDALSRLSHPGIVPILAHGTHEGLPWYAMAYLPGKLLSALVDREKQPAPREQMIEALTICRRLCHPLAYIHGEGLVHRDLKPDNVLLRPGGIPVLIDFGLASVQPREGREALEPSGATVGTIAYMAPEQVKGELVDARTDLYSLGCVLYQLLSGEPPFVGPPSAILQKHCHEEPRSLTVRSNEIPRELDDLVLRLLAKDPARRFGYATDVAAALARIGARNGTFSGAPRGRSYLYRPTLAGRTGEIGRATSRIRALARGTGGFLVLTGESGVGKTRFAMEVGRLASGDGARVLLSACPAEGRAPLQAFRGALQGIADGCRELGGKEVARVLGPRAAVLAAYEPSISAFVAAGDGAIQLPAQEARQRLLHDLAETLGAAAARDATLFLLDDVQWADELSRDALQLLVTTGMLARTPLLIVATCRAEEMPGWLESLAALGGIELMPLGRLDASAVAAMSRDMLASEVPEGFAAAVARTSSGNPLFVAECLRLAVEQRVLARDEEGMWGFGPLAATYDHAIPPTVEAILSRRIQGLPRHARRVLDAAAVLGDELTEGRLLLASPGVSAVAARVQELVRRQILEPREGAIAFTHDRIREVAYDVVEPGRRRRLHRRAASVLTGEGSPSNAEAIARHWELCGEPGRALPHLLAAAGAAYDRHASVDAARLYERYLALVPSPSLESAQARVAIAEGPLFAVGRFRDAEREARRALEQATSLDSPDLVAMASFALARAITPLGSWENAWQLYEPALAHFKRSGNGPMEARTETALGTLALDAGMLEQAQARHERSRARYREIGDESGEIGAIAELAVVAGKRGMKSDALGWIREALARAVAAGDRRREAVLLNNLGVMVLDGGEPAEALAHLQRSLEASRALRLRQREAQVRGNIAAVLSALGRFDESAGYLAGSLALHRETGSVQGEAGMLASLGALRANQGDFAGGLEATRAASDLFRNLGAQSTLVLALVHESRMERVATGDVARARALAEEALTVSRALGDPVGVGEAECQLARAAMASGLHPGEHLERARAALEQGGRRKARLVETIDAIAIDAAAFERGERFPVGQSEGTLLAPELAWLREHRPTALAARREAPEDGRGAPRE